MTDHRDEYRRALRDTMAKLTAQSVPETEDHLHEKLSAVTTAAVALIRGAELADVMLIEDERFESVAATHPTVGDLDAVQMRFREGPCLEAADDGGIVRIHDFTLEKRWPDFTSAALSAGVRSALTFKLYTHQHGTGALNVFSRAAGAFNLDDEAIGAMLATHASILLIATVDGAARPSTLAKNDLIGQAKGILMERFVIDSATAFTLMMTRAQTAHTSLHDIADTIIDSV